jgi:hypothetical protein
MDQTRQPNIESTVRRNDGIERRPGVEVAGEVHRVIGIFIADDFDAEVP